MEKKLILKMKLNRENKNLLKLKTEDNECNVYYTKDMDDVLVKLLYLMDIDKQEIEKLEQNTKLSSVLALIKQGFTIRIDEIENDHLRFIAFKGNASITFGVSQEMGIASLLQNAEDFAEEFLEEEKDEKSI